jgi:hypothetical protein
LKLAGTGSELFTSSSLSCSSIVGSMMKLSSELWGKF